jgi:hypothetical protein
MKRNCTPGMFALLLTLVLLGQVGSASDMPKGQPPVFTVPTTGSIIDVKYMPEFDDWWVKCREGESIAVYSYDRQTKKWGKVIFVPDKAKASAQKREKPKTHETPKPTQEAKPSTADEGIKTQSAPEKKKEAVPSPKRGAQEKEKKPSKGKWWDPLGILKTK